MTAFPVASGGAPPPRPARDGRRVLVLSQGPVPMPGQKRVEGGGLRCWGLATGLLANDPTLQITVAFHDSYAVDGMPANHLGIEIATWTIADVQTLLDPYDSVVVSYCMGELSSAVVEHLRSDQQLVLDCYVPIHVEVSARDSDDVEEEHRAFQHDMFAWNTVLARGDVFLCASAPQKRYYQGVLAALGRVNPISYGTDPILVVPYGVHREPPVASATPVTDRLGNRSTKRILWFGGIYPWFDLTTLVDAVRRINEQTPATLVIVGARNPFNTHPDFVRRHDELVDYVESTPGAEDVVLLEDWVRFEDRVDWYLDCDVVVLVNREGLENELAWRTRLVDFVWSETVIVTNGGDPLGEELISRGAAVRIHGTAPEVMAEQISALLDDEKAMEAVREATRSVKPQLYWDVATAPLAEQIREQAMGEDRLQVRVLDAPPRGRVRGLIEKLRLLPAYSRRHGVRVTLLVIRSILLRRLNRARGNRRPQIHLVSHQLDLSGAPFVFMDVARALWQHVDARETSFHTFFPAHVANVRRLNEFGITPHLYRTKEIVIPFVEGDVVVLNTVAHATVLKQSIYTALREGTVKKLIWYVHEDEPHFIFDPTETATLRSLMKRGLVEFHAAAAKTVASYREYFEVDAQVHLQPYHFEVPKSHHRVLGQGDFDVLRFSLAGAVGDGRKGQMPIFYAFKSFLDRFHAQNPDAYREFELIYVGLGTDFLSRQLIKHADALGGRFTFHGTLEREEYLDVIAQANVTICYSMRESLPLFVFEGMAAGHALLRNDSSGLEEQLVDGENGHLLRTDDYDDVVHTIERLLNRGTTSDEELARMSAKSNAIAVEQEGHSYQPIVGSITDAFRGGRS